MKTHHISVAKSARYFSLGDIGPLTRHLWIVCHGYKQLAGRFLKKFETLQNEETVIVAPEGFHRFYIEGHSGHVGASWMTKEDRLNDIADYVGFLDDLVEHLLSEVSDPSVVQIHVLGFSQGTATVCRWLCRGKTKTDHLVMWAGMFPPDLEFEVDQKIFQALKLQFVFGNQDDFLKPGMLEKQEGILTQNNIQYDIIRFEGKHNIYPEVLRQMV